MFEVIQAQPDLPDFSASGLGAEVTLYSTSLEIQPGVTFQVPAGDGWTVTPIPPSNPFTDPPNDRLSGLVGGSGNIAECLIPSQLMGN